MGGRAHGRLAAAAVPGDTEHSAWDSTQSEAVVRGRALGATWIPDRERQKSS